MKHLLFLLILCSSCSQETPSSSPKSQGQKIGELRGTHEINLILQQRLINESSFHIQHGLGAYESSDGYFDGLGAILGAYGQEGQYTKYRNAMPTPVSFTLWQMAFDIFSRKIVEDCHATKTSEDQNYAYHDRSKEAVNMLCGQRLSDKDLESLWFTVMGWRVPAAELEAFKQFYAANWQQFTAPRQTHELLLWLFMNPYFLLHY